MSPIVDQGELGSCTANAIVSGLREYLELKEGKELTPLSRLFLYWHERDVEGTVNEDSGAYIRDGMKALTDIGVAPETDFPYDVSKFTLKPSDQAEKDAANFKITSYHRVTDLNGLRSDGSRHRHPDAGPDRAELGVSMGLRHACAPGRRDGQ
jgi:C1A family cysteine protease